MESHQLLRRLVLAAVVVAFGIVTAAEAQRPNPTTAVTTKKMCPNCAKKIASKLYAVPGVIEVRANVKKDVAFVTPQRSKTLSPKALWTAVEQAGHVVVKLSGPSGVFTTKPTR